MRWILVLGSGLVSLVVAELVARPLYGPGFQSLVDPYEHHPFRPFARVQDVYNGVPFATNSLGWKDVAPRTITPRPKSRRVVVLGDSYAEGLGLAAADTIPARLGDALGSEVEVLNGGRVSYSPLLELMRLRRYLDQGYRADLVIVMADRSDPQDDLFYRSAYRTAEDGTPIERHDAMAAPAVRFLYNHLALLRLARRAQLRLQGRALAPGEAAHGAKAVQLSDADRVALSVATLSHEQYLALSDSARVVLRSNWFDHPPSREGWARDGLESVEANLSRIHQLCQQHGMTMLLLIYPDPLALYTAPEQWQAWSTSHPRWFGERAQLLGQTPGDGALAFRRPLLAWAEREGVAAIDLWPHFLSRSDAPSFFLPDDIHFNINGAREVARAVAPLVAARLVTQGAAVESAR